jgi:hypothetical protein
MRDKAEEKMNGNASHKHAVDAIHKIFGWHLYKTSAKMQA